MNNLIKKHVKGVLFIILKVLNNVKCVMKIYDLLFLFYLKKNLDFIIANSAIEKGTGFEVDTNKITIIDKHNNITNFELKTKQEVAKDIVNFSIHLTK